MNDVILQGVPPLPVTLRRSARARRMTLRVSRLDGRVTLTVPNGVSRSEAEAFATERDGWIRKHLASQVARETVGPGSKIPVLGAMREVVPGKGRAVELRDSEIFVPGPEAQVGRKARAWLVQLARSELAFASDRYAEVLGQGYKTLSIRDTRSRWGSCSSAGGLNYSWRLIMAPAEVLSYVAAHEVSHLAEMNHSPAFWSTVERIYGDYRDPKAWLRKEGHRLHSYVFGD